MENGVRIALAGVHRDGPLVGFADRSHGDGGEKEWGMPLESRETHLLE